MKIRLSKSRSTAAGSALLAGAIALTLAAPQARAQDRERERAAEPRQEREHEEHEHEAREPERDGGRERERANRERERGDQPREREARNDEAEHREGAHTEGGHAESTDGCQCEMCQKAAARKKEEAARRKEAEGDRNREAGEHMMAMIREMRELNRTGHHEEANRIGEKVRAMMQEHPEVARKVRAAVGGGPMNFGPGGPGPMGPMAGGPGPMGGPPPMVLERIERALNDARAQGDEEMVGQLERKLHAAREMVGHGQPQPPHGRQAEQPHGGDEVANRVRHIHEAAAHLDAAGMHELAGRLRQEAREIEAQHHQGHAPAAEAVQRQLDEMREALENLHREIREIGEEIDD